MAIIAPFRGLHYNPAKVPNLTEVVTPPYDVIRPAEREAFAARHPNNMVHLILPRLCPGMIGCKIAIPGRGRFSGNGNKTKCWYGIRLRRSIIGRPIFSMPGAPSPGGLAALVRLEPLSGGGIRPHEQTFSAAKADRLEVIKAAQANFSPIFYHLSRPRRPGGEPAQRRPA